MYLRFRHYVETHLSLILMAFFVLGLVVPGLEKTPSWVVPALIAAVIFLSSSKIAQSDLGDIHYGHAAVFTVVRYILLPLCLFAVTDRIMPSYSLSIFLLALLPAGVTSPALANLMGGNITLALGIVVVSSLLAPASIPLALSISGKTGVTLDTTAMFWNLASIVVLPMLLQGLCSRRLKRVTRWSKDNASCFAILLISSNITIAIAQRRNVLLNDIPFLIKGSAVVFAVFFFLYAVGWLFPGSKNKRVRIAHAVTSGATNIALGISLALLYFPPEVSLFMVLTAVPWILSVPLFRAFLAQQQS